MYMKTKDDARRSAHAVLLDRRRRGLARALEEAAPSDEPSTSWIRRKTANDAILLFCATWRDTLGAAPFIFGLAAYLEEVRTRTHVSTWEIDATALVEAGTRAFVADLVALFATIPIFLKREEDTLLLHLHSTWSDASLWRLSRSIAR
jgi:hypothetical protein